MKVLPRSVMALCAVLFWPLSTQAASTGVAGGMTQGAISVMERLHIFFKNTRVINAYFQQSLIDSKGNKVQEASGTLVMQRPGKFRWDYLKPYHQIIFADGKEITIYDEELQQATVRSMSRVIGNTPALLLSGAQPLEANFTIAEAASKIGLDWLELTPKLPDSGFEHIRLGFDSNDLRAMEMLDSFGQTTSMRFTDMKRNITPAPDLFAFTPPAGTDIVRETGL